MFHPNALLNAPPPSLVGRWLDNILFMGCSLFNVLAGYDPFLCPNAAKAANVNKSEGFNMDRYTREQVQRLQDDIQYHETMKRQHDEAIAKLSDRIKALTEYAVTA